ASRQASAASDERGSGLTSPLAGHLTQHGGQLARLAEQQSAARVVIEGDVPGADLYRIDSCSLRAGPQARIVTAAAPQVEIERAAGGWQPLLLLRAGRALRRDDLRPASRNELGSGTDPLQVRRLTLPRLVVGAPVGEQLLHARGLGLHLQFV